MRKPLLILASVAAVLFVADALLQRAEDSARTKTSVGVPLIDPAKVSTSAVAGVQLGVPPSGILFQLKDGFWRAPDFRGAYVLPDNMKALLAGLIPGLGNPISSRKQDLPHYGFVPGRALVIRLLDAAGSKLAEVAVGRGVAGSAAGEAYVHLSGTKEIFLLRFNPRAVVVPTLGPKAPPMLDPYVLPKAFPRRGIQRIRYSGMAKFPIEEIHMVLLSTGPPQPPKPGEKEKPTVEWRARTRDGAWHVLESGNAAAFSGYLDRLRYQDILPLSEVLKFTAKRGALLISDDAGAEDVLELGQDVDDGKGTLVRNRRAGLVFIIDTRKLPLFFPPLAALAGKEPLAPIFAQAEPYEGMAADPSAVESPQ